MKKLKQKVVFVLIMAIIGTVLLSTSQVYAVPEMKISDVNYSYEGMTKEKAEQIVKSILGISDEVSMQPFNILCVFGHDIKTGMVTTTEHNYYSTSPRCKITESAVEYCGRSGCDYYSVKGEMVSRASCH